MGGGVCQDSTTVFRAAFWAGLPITERHAHPFYISWYDAFSYPDGEAAPGMDATIFTGVADLKFVNDTGHWLLMEATTDDDNQTLTVRLYGTKPNRTVGVKGPEIDNQVPASIRAGLPHRCEPAGRQRQADRPRTRRQRYHRLPDYHRERRPEAAGAVLQPLQGLAGCASSVGRGSRIDTDRKA